MPASAPRETFRFNDFELDVAAYQLRRQGRVVRLERQPMDVLILLVERRRQLVSRADIVERLWGKDVFVDVDTGVHTAIRKIRQALGDSISAPAFVETVPSKGYRFVADVEVVSRPSDSGVGRRARGTFAGAGTPADERRHDRRTPWSRIDRESGRGIGACGRLRNCSGVATVVGASGACADSGGGRRPGDRPGRMDAAQWGRASLTGHTRRAAVRVPRQRSRARVSGRRPHRGDQRVAGTDRSRAPDRQGSHVGLQGHREDGRADRPGTLGRLSRGEYASSGGQPAARDHHADSCAGSGACLVAVLRSRSDQSPGPATGTEHKHRRADSPSAVAR